MKVLFFYELCDQVINHSEDWVGWLGMMVVAGYFIRLVKDKELKVGLQVDFRTQLRWCYVKNRSNDRNT